MNRWGEPYSFYLLQHSVLNWGFSPQPLGDCDKHWLSNSLLLLSQRGKARLWGVLGGHNWCASTLDVFLGDRNRMWRCNLEQDRNSTLTLVLLLSRSLWSLRRWWLCGLPPMNVFCLEDWSRHHSWMVAHVLGRRNWVLYNQKRQWGLLSSPKESRGWVFNLKCGRVTLLPLLWVSLRLWQVPSPYFPLIPFTFRKSEHFRGKKEVILPLHAGHCWKDGLTHEGHSGSSILSMVEGDFHSFLFAFRGLYIIMTFFSKQNVVLFLSAPPPTFLFSSPTPHSQPSTFMWQWPLCSPLLKTLAPLCGLLSNFIIYTYSHTPLFTRTQTLEVMICIWGRICSICLPETHRKVTPFN